MMRPLAVLSIGSLSPLGSNSAAIHSAYQQGRPQFGDRQPWAARLTEDAESACQQAVSGHRAYRHLDRSTQMGIAATRLAWSAAQHLTNQSASVCIGSSRGATGLWEQNHQHFLAGKKVSPLSSPTTTMGNLSSWVAQDLSIQGLAVDQSVTCSTAIHALIQANAWICAGYADCVVTGAAEAPLTPFTFAQMKALRIYADQSAVFPCEPMNRQRNSLILGEGACIFVVAPAPFRGQIAQIIGIGFAREQIDHPVSISDSGNAIRQSMERAINDANLEADDIDAVVIHAPGTVKGDLAELEAMHAVFGAVLPQLISNKWLIGHALAAAGAFNLELAILACKLGHCPYSAFRIDVPQFSRPISRVLVNATGFGGNAASLIVTV